MEKWKEIRGYEGRYSISNLGNVLSHGRVDPLGRTYLPKILKPSFSPYAGVILRKDGENKRLLVHRLVASNFLEEIMGGFVIDHIDGDKLNNQVSNLRICTQQENCANRKPTKNSASVYKGVSRSRKKWVSGIKIGGKTIRLGTFETEVEAARAYDSKLLEVYGRFAWTNFKEKEAEI